MLMRLFKRLSRYCSGGLTEGCHLGPAVPASSQFSVQVHKLHPDLPSLENVWDTDRGRIFSVYEKRSLRYLSGMHKYVVSDVGGVYIATPMPSEGKATGHIDLVQTALNRGERPVMAGHVRLDEGIVRLIGNSSGHLQQQGTVRQYQHALVFRSVVN
jgi:hypothetical protein